MDLTKGKFFVIMPFTGESPIPNWNFETIYKNFIKLSLKELGYACERADRNEEVKSSSIIKNIFNPLCNPDNFVLADLTNNNPNVFYELGVRHALNIPGTILISLDIKTVPFDLKDRFIIQYSINEMEKFQQKIVEHLEKYGASPISEYVDNYYEIIDTYSKWKQRHEALEAEYYDKIAELENAKAYQNELIKINESIQKVNHEIVNLTKMLSH